MASDVGAPAAADLAEEVAARTRDLVWRLLRPGGPVDVEVVANAAYEGARREVASGVYTLRREDVETLAVGAATGALTVIVCSRNGPLNLPRDVVEAAITKAVADIAAKDNNSALYRMLAFSVVATVVSFGISLLALS